MVHTGPADRDVSLPNGLSVAPGWRRLVAGLINTTVAIVSLAGVGLGGYKLRRFLRPLLDPLMSRLVAWGEAQGSENDKRDLSPRTRMLFEIVGLTLELNSRNRRSVGARAMRIRRGDALTGGPVTLRSALLSHWVQRATSAGLRPVAEHAHRGFTERMRALQPQLKELERAYADDKPAQQRALKTFYREHDVNPFRSCAPTLLTLAAPSLPALFSSRRQTLPERVAGIVWVQEDPRNQGWSPPR